MAAPKAIASEFLDALKGWPSPTAVDFKAGFDPNINTRVPRGACVRLNSNGYFALGVGNLFAMPLFTRNASDDKDVVNDGGNVATDKRAWVAVGPTGAVMALPAAGAYELISTYYNKNGSYAPNTPLSSPVTASGGVEAGMLTNVATASFAWKAFTIVGICSRGVQDNGYGYSAVTFWPVCIPATV